MGHSKIGDWPLLRSLWLGSFKTSHLLRYHRELPARKKKAPPDRGEWLRPGVPLFHLDVFGRFRKGQVGLAHDLIPKFLWLQP